MSTAPADRRSQKPPAARKFTLGRVVLKKLEPGAAVRKLKLDNRVVAENA
ncbi:MAG: hypothetical protein HYY97_15490 [Rhodocyclales bacterium]|nr:hypothetical protein [Rhodocyclales bacterium]